MYIVINEKDLAKSRPYKIEIKFNDEKVADFLKHAKDVAKDGIITSSDVIGWIPSAVEGNIYLRFPGTDKFYYISPKCWKMEIVARLNDDKLSGEIIDEICLKTAKNLTTLLQADLKMHENPPTFEEFLKDNFEEFEAKKEKLTITYKTDCIDQVMKVTVRYKPSIFEKAEWTYNEDVDSIFDSETESVRVRIETNAFVFEKLVFNENEKDFYETLIKELQSVPLFGSALVASFRVVYRKNIRKDLESWRIAHNERARKAATDSEMAVRVPARKDSSNFEVRMVHGNYVFRVFCEVSPGLQIRDMDKFQFWSAASMFHNFNIVVNRIGSSSGGTITKACFQRDHVESCNHTLMAVTDFLRGLVDYPNVVAENLLEHFRTNFIKEFSKDTPSQEINKEEILAKVKELHRKEMEWKMLDRHYRQKFFNEIKSLSPGEYHHSREIDNLKKSMQSLGNEIEDLYAKICIDLS